MCITRGGLRVRHVLLLPRGGKIDMQKSAESIVGFRVRQTEGLNILIVVGYIEVYRYGEAENRHRTLCR